MFKPKDPRQLAVDLLPRSSCAVQVAACLADRYGIFGWGINNAGPTGLGEHAEQHCIKRANRRRIQGATLYIAAQRRRTFEKIVTARPCPRCQQIIRGCLEVVYRDNEGKWRIWK